MSQSLIERGIFELRWQRQTNVNAQVTEIYKLMIYSCSIISCSALLYQSFLCVNRSLYLSLSQDTISFLSTFHSIWWMCARSIYRVHTEWLNKYLVCAHGQFQSYIFNWLRASLWNKLKTICIFHMNMTVDGRGRYKTLIAFIINIRSSE